MAKLVIGCGYLGSRVARRWAEAGKKVHAVTRSAERAEEFRRRGWQPVVADVTRPATLAALPNAETVLYAVGLDRAAAATMREVYVDGLRAVLDALPPPGKLIYISSTGVYGGTSGAWIDEDTPCAPARESGRVCLEAENLLRAHRLGQRSVILRLAGIYGPGRLPNRAALQAGEPITSDPDGYLNLIHVEDAAAAVLAADERAVPPRLYIVSDGHPVPRRDYYAQAARLIGAPPPQFAAGESAKEEGRGRRTNRRMRNARMRGELQLQLEYPTFRQGLAAGL